MLENLSNFPNVTVRTNPRGIQTQKAIYYAVYNLFSEVCSNHITLALGVTSLPGEAR